jgi:ribose-phosphate pyrophosphokinase
MDKTLIFAGSASRRLTAKICGNLGVPVGKNETFTFSEGNTFVRILENVRRRDTFIVQTTVFPANDTFMELLFYVDALKRASARSVTAVIPYFSYAKGDKKDEPRVAIRARVCANALEAAGVDRVVTVDLHAPQIQGFFSVPVDNLMALPILADRVLEEVDADGLVVVAADAGFAKQAREFASYLGVPVAIADKMRVAHDDSAEVLGVLGTVDGKTAVIVDDFAISAKTLCGTAESLLDMGASSVYAAITHGVFTPEALQRVEQSEIVRLFVTDTIEHEPSRLGESIAVVPIDGLLSEAIRRIRTGESISVMFDWKSKPRAHRRS